MSGTDYTATLDLSYAGNLSKGVVILTQTPRGSLPSQFKMDSFGRISVPSEGGSFTCSVTCSLSRNTTGGGTGNLWCTAVFSDRPPQSEPPGVILPFLGSGGAGSSASLSNYTAPNALNESLEVALEFTGGANVGVSGGTITLVLHQEEQHICNQYDPSTGFRVHREVLPIFASASAIGPPMGWCTWCRETLVTSPPLPKPYSVG